MTLHVHISLDGKELAISEDHLQHFFWPEPTTTALQSSILSFLSLHMLHLVVHGLNASTCLEKHTDDGHHGESAVCQLGRPRLGLETSSIH